MPPVGQFQPPRGTCNSGRLWDVFFPLIQSDTSPPAVRRHPTRRIPKTGTTTASVMKDSTPMRWFGGWHPPFAISDLLAFEFGFCPSATLPHSTSARAPMRQLWPARLSLLGLCPTSPDSKPPNPLPWSLRSATGIITAPGPLFAWASAGRHEKRNPCVHPPLSFLCPPVDLFCFVWTC